MWYMFTGQFFKGNLNFVILEMLEAISKAQVYLENNILRDYNNYTIYAFFDPLLLSQGPPGSLR